MGGRQGSKGAGSGGLILRARELSLEELDRLDAADLLAFVAKEERPLQGLAGLLDWRLGGKLNALLKEDFYSGNSGEALLTVAQGRLPAQRIFLYGLGATEAGSSHFPAAMEAVAQAGGRDLALQPPAWGKKALNTAVSEWVQQAHQAGIHRLTLLSADPRAMDKALAVAESTFPWAHLED